MFYEESVDSVVLVDIFQHGPSTGVVTHRTHLLKEAWRMLSQQDKVPSTLATMVLRGRNNKLLPWPPKSPNLSPVNVLDRSGPWRPQVPPYMSEIPQQSFRGPVESMLKLHEIQMRTLGGWPKERDATAWSQRRGGRRSIRPGNSWEKTNAIVCLIGVCCVITLVQ